MQTNANSHLNELLWIQRTMPVATRRHWLWQHHASGIASLKDAGEIDATCNLTNQHRRESL